MKRIDCVRKLCAAASLAVLAAMFCAAAQGAEKQQYKLVDLGPSGPAGQPFHITNNGLVSAAVEVPDGSDPSVITDHSVIYFHGHMIDISNPGLGGANSMAFGNNGWGQVVGGANTATEDPAGEDFCGFQTLGLPSAATTCLPYLWQNGRMSALPTLDDNRGNNGVANSINDFGEAAGASENTTTEPSCPVYDPGQMQFQQYQFKPVVWRHGAVTELATVGGDRVGTALSINNKGQVAGASGACSSFNLQFFIPIHPLHAVFWDKDGTPIEIESLGGDEQSVMGNLALGINYSGQVVGFSSLADDVTFHAFLWSRETGRMIDLGTVPGVANSSAIAINDSGVAVGISADATHFLAAIWKHGKATDLNKLIPANSPLYLLIACSINSKGQIIGLAVDGNGSLHGYELDPVGE
jgi:probable HAF family extracellular repeat protein